MNSRQIRKLRRFDEFLLRNMDKHIEGFKRELGSPNKNFDFEVYHWIWPEFFKKPRKGLKLERKVDVYYENRKLVIDTRYCGTPIMWRWFEMDITESLRKCSSLEESTSLRDFNVFPCFTFKENSNFIIAPFRTASGSVMSKPAIYYNDLAVEPAGKTERYNWFCYKYTGECRENFRKRIDFNDALQQIPDEAARELVFLSHYF